MEVDISDFFNGSKLKINTQNNYEGSYGNGYIQNLYVDNKEIVKKLIESYETIIKEKDEQIKLLKEKLL